MNQFNAVSLKAEYFSWLNEEETFNDVGYDGRPVVRIDTPFLDESFDGIDLYVYPDSVNRVRVTDNGETLNRLEGQGIFFNGRTRERNKMLADVLSSFGIEREDNSKKLFIVTTRQNFPDAKRRLLQGVLKINDLIYTNSRNVQGLLQDQVADALKQNHILFSKNRALVATNGQSFIFDFLIPTQSHGDTVVRAFHSPQRSDSAKVYAWDAARINQDIQMRPGKYVAIVDDNNASTKSVAQFCDILNSNDDIPIESILVSTLEESISTLSNN